MAMNQSPLGGQLWKPGAQAPTVVGGKTFTPAAYYPSSSNPKNGYTICEVSDGTVSCNCMGWTRRNPPGGRTCKHTQDYIQYLRPLWNSQGQGAPVPLRAAVAAQPEIQSSDREKGGTLSELFAKLEKGGLHGS
jgi:hypothetical protein